MRNSSTIRFLETIGNGQFDNAFEAFLFSAGSTSLLRRNLRNVGRVAAPTQFDDERKARQRFRVMTHRLKKDGLIVGKQGGLMVRLTEKARAVVSASKNKDNSLLPRNVYVHKKSDTVTLILFDIPERHTRKRAWLRETLRMLGFELLQRSVWIGKVAIPGQFLEDIRDMKINEYVEIVNVARSGTIKKINP